MGKTRNQQSLLSEITKGMLGLQDVETSHDAEMRLLEMIGEECRPNDLAVFNTMIGTHVS